MERFEGAQQDRLPVAVATRDDVDAVVHPVREVDVEVPGWSEHHGVARRPPAIAVTRRIVRRVGLDLDDPTGTTIDDEHLVEQLRRNDGGVTGEEVIVEPSCLRHVYSRRSSRIGRTSTGTLAGEEGSSVTVNDPR